MRGGYNPVPPRFLPKLLDVMGCFAKNNTEKLVISKAVLSHWAAIFLSPFREASVGLCSVGEWWLMSSILSALLLGTLPLHTHPARGDVMKALAIGNLKVCVGSIVWKTLEVRASTKCISMNIFKTTV